MTHLELNKAVSDSCPLSINACILLLCRPKARAHLLKSLGSSNLSFFFVEIVDANRNYKFSNYEA